MNLMGPCVSKRRHGLLHFIQRIRRTITRTIFSGLTLGLGVALRNHQREARSGFWITDSFVDLNDFLVFPLVCFLGLGQHAIRFIDFTDILVDPSQGLAPGEVGSPIFQFDALVRDAFLPRSPIVDPIMASQLASLYNPQMGVENAGPLLYSVLRFTKSRRIVEIGAG